MRRLRHFVWHLFASSTSGLTKGIPGLSIFPNFQEQRHCIHVVVTFLLQCCFAKFLDDPVEAVLAQMFWRRCSGKLCRRPCSVHGPFVRHVGQVGLFCVLACCFWNFGRPCMYPMLLARTQDRPTWPRRPASLRRRRTLCAEEKYLIVF